MPQSTYSVSFDGVNDSVSAAVDLSPYSQITLSYWAKFPSLPQPLLFEHTANFNTNAGGFAVTADDGIGTNHTLSMFGFSTTGPSYWLDYFTTPADGLWHHYLVVMDRSGRTNAAWIDGVSATLTTARHDVVTYGNFANSTLYWMSRAGSSLFGAGSVDDVALWSGDQSAHAAGLAAGTTDPTTLTTGLLDLWRMEEGSGSSLASATFGGAVGIISGASWSTDVPAPLSGGGGTLAAGALAYAISLGSATFAVSDDFPAGALSYAISLGSATFVVSDDFPAGALSYAISLGSATFAVSDDFPAGALSYAIGIGSATLGITGVMPAGGVSYAVAIADATLTSSRILVATGISLTIPVGGVNLDYSGGMPGVYAIEGLVSMLAFLLDGAVFWLHLFTNDVQPSKTLKASDMIEPVYAGYVPQPADRWTPPALRGTVAFANVDPLIFTFTSGTAPLPVRGYYVTNGQTGPLLWAWRQPGPGFQFDTLHPTLVVNAVLTFPIVC